MLDVIKIYEIAESGNTEQERNTVILEDIPMNNHINEELSTIPFH